MNVPYARARTPCTLKTKRSYIYKIIILRYSLQEDDLLEWDSYSPPVGNDQRGGGGVGSGKKDPLLRPFSSSSSCGVISDACHWPLDSSPHVSCLLYIACFCIKHEFVTERRKIGLISE